MPAMPVGPLLPSALICKVSAWSPAWCPSSRCNIPASVHAASSAAKRACRARSASPGPGSRPWITRIFAAMPRPPSRATVSVASLPDSPRRPWSTTSACNDQPRWRAQVWASKAKPMLSAPPETPAAIRSAGSKGPSAAMREANSSSVTTHLGPITCNRRVDRMRPSPRGDQVSGWDIRRVASPAYRRLLSFR